MNSRITAIAALCCAAMANSVSAATIWSEDFNDPSLDQKGATFDQIDMAGVSRWSIDVSSAELTATSDWFRVQNALMEARDTDGEVQWQSEAIDISGQTDVTISVEASENGTMETLDYFDLAYSIDGGSFVTITNYNGQGDANHTLIDDFTSATITQNVGTGSSLVIRVAMKNNAGTEYIRLDNVVVSSGEGGDGGEDGGSLEGVCFNCPDLDKIADADAFDPASYYAAAITEINAMSSADAIKMAINNIITQDHRVLSYSEVWTALTESDEDPNNSDNVIVLYRGISLPKLSNGSGAQSTDPDNWNREHVWPNSHGFNNSGFEAYTDIHHLRPSDISVNSSRGNLDFDDSDSPLAEAPENRVDGDSFEPRDEVKGDVARMMFYMDTRYEGFGSDVTPDLKLVDSLTSPGVPELGKLCRLVEWHTNDPVSELERQRNDTLYEYQGNRNPFIDNPEWVEEVYSSDACSTDDGGDDGGGEGPVSTTGAIFISEYIEGSSFNKAIELYNPTGSDIDLAAGNYILERYSNGNTNATAISLDGVIPANGTYVIVNGQANSDIIGKADQVSGSISHNGDDDYVLTADGVVIDSFGQVGVDPGSSYGSGDFSTANNTLIRNPNVYAGDTVVDDEFDPSIEWTGLGNDVSSDLGMHTITPREIFISEYIEGSSFNKAIEIFNPSGVTVDLAAGGYRLARYSNGSTSPTFINLSGSVASGDVFVVANPSAIQAILDESDLISGSISHNGDDAYELLKGDEIIDSFGRVGEDPGSSWSSNGVSTVNSTLVRKSSVGSGDPISTDEFLPDLEWESFPSNTTSELGSHTFGGGDGGGVDPAPEFGVCNDPATFIHEIQGSGDASPLVGNAGVVIEGVVTAAYQGSGQIGGFFVQEEDTDVDDNAATSEGIYVFDSTNTVNVGDVVRLQGTVAETFGVTQLTSLTNLASCGMTASVTAAAITLPVDSLDRFEQVEGMLVALSQPLYVNEIFQLGRFGEVVLSDRRNYQFTHNNAPDAVGYEAHLADLDLRKIILDDGRRDQNPENISYLDPDLSASNPLRGGSVTSLTAVMDFGFGNYRLQPIGTVLFSDANPRTETPEDVGGNFKVVGVNVLNYFTTLDIPGSSCGPNNLGCRGAESELEFARQKAKIVAALTKIDADILGLVEIENNASESLSDLVEGLNAVAGAGTYAFVNTGTIGTDAIKVGLIYKPASATPTGSHAILDSSIDPLFIDDKNRPVLAQTFTTTDGEVLTIAVNHLKSKGSSCNDLGDFNLNDGQGNCAATRANAATVLVNWLASDPTSSGDDDFLILGDLNAYPMEDAITNILQAGYTDLIEAFVGAEAYSYVFDGELSYLDHALASASLTDKVSDVTEWHINADEPNVLDYNTNFKSDTQIERFYAPDAYRMSDHDPVIVGFNFEPAGLRGDLDGDGDVDNRDILVFIFALRPGLTPPASYDFNNDGVVTRQDVFALRALCTRVGCSPSDAAPSASSSSNERPVSKALGRRLR